MASVSSESHKVSTLSLPALSLSRLTSPSPQSPARIDYLSSLPNELLDNIFGYLYDQTPPPLPLSKRLRPWFEKHFYRKLSFSSFDSLVQFADTLFDSPRIAQYVYVLRLEEDALDDDSSEEDSSEEDAFEEPSRKSHRKSRELHSLLPALLPLLTHLVKLDVPCTPSILPPLDKFLSAQPFLPRLRYLTTSFESDDDGFVALDVLKQYAKLPVLKRLRIYDWDEDDFRNCHRSESTLLPGVTTLEIRGHAAFKSSVRTLTSVFPSLLHLELRSTESYGSGHVDYIQCLPNTLLSLSISAADFYDFNSELAHLRRLRYLHLGSAFSSEDVSQEN